MHLRTYFATAVTVFVLLSSPVTAHTHHHTKVNNDMEEHARKAIAALQLALPDLQNAAVDYCGHRNDALTAINTAVAQLTQGVSCMKGHALSYETHKKGRLPNVRAAHKELKKTRKDLQNNDESFCGNRVSALNAVDNAISQLQAVMDCNQ